MDQIIGIDVGGTFTDLVAFDPASRRVKTLKVFSTPEDPSAGLLHGLSSLGVPLTEVAMIVHGTTVATNAVIERTGAQVGLLTTQGFRDVIEIRRRDRPHDYGLTGDFKPLIPRYLRLEVDERADHRGNILKPLDREEVERLGRKLLEEGVEAVVVSFLHSYASPENERRAREVLESFWPNDFIELSSEVLPEFREFERTTTAVVNAYVRPKVSRYLRSVRTRLQKQGFCRDLILIQSNGGGMSLEAAERYSVNTILSGPAAGAIAAAYIARSAGYPKVISADMGGTSFDAALILDGRPALTANRQLEFGIPLRVSMIDITTIGAGGGSIAFLDAGGLLQVGPRSAGAVPGPVCYGRGGEEPTVTDANLVLGRINPAGSIAEEEGFLLSVPKARRALEERIGKGLRLGLESAAQAVIAVANQKMANALRVVSIEKGHDPRELILVAFGGAGPLHAAALGREIGVQKVLIPYLPGVTSALGCILADLRHDLVQTVHKTLDELRAGEVPSILSHQVSRGREILSSSPTPLEEVLYLFEADMQFQGQTHTLRVSLPSSEPEASELQTLFREAYRRRYGDILIETPIQLINLRTTVVGVRPKLNLRELLRDVGASPPLKGRWPVLFGGEWRDCPIYDRFRLPVGHEGRGPAIIEQPDTTVVVEPGMSFTVDPLGNLLLEAAGRG